MKILKIITSLLVFNLSVYSSSVFAEDFIVQDIQLQGQSHLSLATVLSYLPIKKGEKINAERVRNALSTLYNTGLFEDVVILRDKDNLILKVVERPVIAEVNIEGNRKVEDEMIEEAFDDAGLVSGRIYNATVLDTMRKSLQDLYYSIGRYNVKMDVGVTTLERHRVKIDIDIKEGLQAKIRHINIVGNSAFTDEEILAELETGIPSWWSIFSSKDKYEKSKLRGDLETIDSYYFDRGYLDFKIESTQVSISDDKKDIFVTINVSEGRQYTIDSLQYAGELILPADQYDQLLKFYLSVGDIFSRKKINEFIEAVQDGLGAKGYLYAEVTPLSNVDKESQKVSLTFSVDPKQKIYVNSIVFKGNEKTIDKVYRRELRQMENAVYNSVLVERSRVRIQRLEYVEEVEVKKEPALDRDDAVDIVYEIEERLAGSFNAGLGYSDNGTTFSLGVTQSNLFGTGNALSLNIAKSDTIKNYSISYQNPYYKTDNMGRSLFFNFREYDATGEIISTEYLLDTLGMGATYSMPLSEYSRLSYGFSFGYNELLPINLDTNGNSPVQQIQDFIDADGTENDYLRLSTSYMLDKRDRRIFAKRGSLNEIAVQLTTPISDVAYYKLSYLGEKYFYTPAGSVLLKARVAYGDGYSGSGDLPFYEKYVAGGVRSLRGFESRSIGPLEIRTDGLRVDTLGGNLSTIGTLAWLFDTSSISNSLQISLFYEFGGVFEDIDSYDSSDFRSSYGSTLNWLSPMGPLTFSYAFPIEKQETDVTERFQFTIGTSF